MASARNDVPFLLSSFAPLEWAVDDLLQVQLALSPRPLPEIWRFLPIAALPITVFKINLRKHSTVGSSPTTPPKPAMGTKADRVKCK